MAEELYGNGGGGGGGAFTAGASTGGNTAGTTGTVNNGVLFFGGANITLSESKAAGGASLSIIGGAGAAFSGGVSTGGNTAGTTGTVGNGVLFFGGNSITLSQSSAAGGATVSVVGPSAWSQTGGISNLGNTAGTSGIASGSAVRLLFAGGNNVTLSQSVNGASATITVSAFNQTVESQTLGMSNLGNTSGTSGVASGAQVRYLLAGGNNITLSQSINGASGTVTISAASQTLQTSNLFDLTLSGNTSGALALVSSGTLTLAGGNNITLSQAGNAITISGGAGGAFTGGVSSGGNTAGTTGTVNNGILFFGGANVTLSQSSAAGGASVSIVGGAGAAFSGGVSTQGNTSGTTGTVGNGIVFVGGNNITLSQSSAAGGATVTISAPSGGGIGVSSGGNTSGTTGTVDYQMVFVGGNNVTLSQSINGSSGTITISAAAGGAGGAAIGITNTGSTAGTNFTTNTGTVYFQGSNNVTVSNSSAAGSLQTIWISGPTQSVQTQGSVQINGSTGALSFNAGNNMSLSTVASNLTFINVLSSSAIAQNVSNVSSAGTQSSRYALADHAHIGVAGINASGTASTFVGNVMLSGTNLTLVTGGNSSAGSIGFSVAAQSVESQSFGMSNLGNTSGTTGIASGGQMRFLLAGGNNITLSQSLNGASGTITISAGAGGGSQSIGMSNLGNTAGTTGIVSDTAVRYLIVGSNNITLSQSLNGQSGTLSIIGAGGGAFSAGVSTGGNTSGDTKTIGSQLVFAGSNNITLSQSTNGASATITISGPTGGGAGMGSTSNTFGTSGTVGKELYFYGGNQVTLSQSVNASSASLSIFGNPVDNRFIFAPYGAHTSSQQTNTAASFQCVQIPYAVSFSRVDVPIYLSLASSATAATGNIVISSGLVIYSVSNQSTLNPIYGSFGTTTYTWASNTANYNSLTGGRNASFAINGSLGPGCYFVGFQLSTTNNSSIGTATTQLANSVSVLLGSIQTASNIMDFGTTAGASDNFIVGRGVAGSTITGTNATQNLQNINNIGVSAQRANFFVAFRNRP